MSEKRQRLDRGHDGSDSHVPADVPNNILRFGSKRPGSEQTWDSTRSLWELSILALTLYARFKAFGQLKDIKNVIRCNRLATFLVSDDEELKMGVLGDLGFTYTVRFERTGDITDVDKAIGCRLQAVLCTPNNYEGRPRLLHALGDSYLCRFRHNRDVSDVDKAISHYDQAVILTSQDNPDRLHIMNNRGNAYLARFERLGLPADIEKAIYSHAEAALSAPEDHPRKPGWLSNLGSSYLARFGHNGEVSDANKTIEYQHQAVLLTPDGDASKLMFLSNLGDSYTSRFERLGEIMDVDKAIEYNGRALLLTPQDHPARATRLVVLGSSHIQRFEQTQEDADMNMAIDYQSQAVLLTPESHADKPRWLNNLGYLYRIRHEHRGEFSDVQNSLHCHRQAVLLTPDDHVDKPVRLQSLGSSYLTRYEYNGAIPDLNQAMNCYGQAIQLTADHSNNPGLLSALGNSYLARFDRFGQVEDINKAVEYHGQAVLYAPERPVYLMNLGISHNYRFKRLGELADVDKGLQCLIRALLLTPDSFAHRPEQLNTIGALYAARYERLGELADIDKAIKYQTESVLLVPDGHPDKPRLLNNLGNSYMDRNKRIGEIADANSSLRFLGQSVLLTPDGHADKPARLNNLGNSYLTRFVHNGEISDADKAIDYQSQAALLTPHDHADQPTWLCSLGSSYLHRFHRNNAVADVDKAIDYHRRAALLMPNGHAGRPEQLCNLGISYLTRFKVLGEVSDLEASSAAFTSATQLVIGDPETRFTAAHEWAKCSLLLGISPQPAYQKLMEVVPELVWLGITIDQRYKKVFHIGDIAMEAAASAISFQLYGCALEWLEQGRSIVWNQILQLRTPFDSLSKANPVLAERLKQVSRELEHVGSGSEMPPLPRDALDLEEDAQCHRRLAAEWDKLLEQARLLPGFDDFMRPRSAKDLIFAAKDGPIVVINVHSSRCDALVVLPNDDDVAHVPLERFSPEKASECHAQLQSSTGHRCARDGGFKRAKPISKDDDPLLAMLEILWLDVVKPILDFLGYTRKLPVDELPHVTWCATGALSFLPLHAAGCYDGYQPKAFDLVISSYAPTLSALLTPSITHTQPHSGILAVGQESTKGLGDLPNTVEELTIIQEHAKQARYLQLDGENATVEAVLNAMDAYSWVHLACHASQNPEDPAQSAFHLHDGDLLLSDITKRSFQNKGLAFLSACQTATGDESLPDEAVHLAAGMLMAGYPSVIATMWGINDEDAPEVARQVYAELLENGEMDHTRASRALHKAVAGLREKVGERAFQRWVPFVHIGS